MKCTVEVDLHSFSSREDVTIVITDSGLGGMSVAADLVERLKSARVFKRVNIIFFNASFDNRSGYNKLNSDAERVLIFNSALERMASIYRPDLIMIACNTLSVIYPKTPFCQSTEIPVIGIVEIGVDLIHRHVPASGLCNIVIFATPTTISSQSHKNLLIERAVSGDSVIGIECPELADYIEEDYQSEKTDNAVDMFVHAAVSEIDRNLPLLVSLNCTHYGFITSLFSDKFKQRGLEPLAILNPNPRMNDMILIADHADQYENPDVHIDVVCKVNIYPDVMASIGHLLNLISPQAADALRHFRRDVHLF